MKRENIGLIIGILGIALNIILFATKFIYAIHSHSMALRADAFNNLMDILSSLMIVLGFFITSKKADKNHPYGHGRMELICGLVVAIIIIFTAVDLAKSGLERIFYPIPLIATTSTYIFLLLAILSKVVIGAINYIWGKKINSQALCINAKDSLADVLATSAVLLSLILQHYFSLTLDGYATVIVALMVLKTGVSSGFEVISSLLGEALSFKEQQKIQNYVLANPMIQSVHHFTLHTYGEHQKTLNFDVEVDGNLSLSYVHAQIDRLERNIKRIYGYTTSIHVDPTLVKQTEIQKKLHTIVQKFFKNYSPQLYITDFNCDPQGQYLFFDVYAPYTFQQTEKNLQDELKNTIIAQWGKAIEVGITLNYDNSPFEFSNEFSKKQ